MLYARDTWICDGQYDEYIDRKRLISEVHAYRKHVLTSSDRKTTTKKTKNKTGRPGQLLQSLAARDTKDLKQREVF